MNLKIEEYALNAWPALQTLVDDGWLLRFADGYTKRSNSVNAIYPCCEEFMEEKMNRAEAMYGKAGLDTVFKITPFVPEALDGALEARGYSRMDDSSVLILDHLNAAAEPELTSVDFFDSLTPQWTNAFVAMNPGLSARSQTAMQKMLSQTVLQAGYFTLYAESVPVACGLGVMEDGFVGLYDIVTSEPHRNRGYGEQLILNMLKWAKENGAAKGYLQVVQNNGSANRLYAKLGYRHLYSYWYRVKRMQ
ncbi:GNAT family N-acetyltransferase [Paenibacillus sp. SAF-054]|uniref:GNAT family N-acetyltransferase n=1 Tax=unclassified Paenibacillus TaxID=185978 RepID=UPI003F8089A1